MLVILLMGSMSTSSTMSAVIWKVQPMNGLRDLEGADVDGTMPCGRGAGGLFSRGPGFRRVHTTFLWTGRCAVLNVQAVCPDHQPAWQQFTEQGYLVLDQLMPVWAEEADGRLNVIKL